MTETIERADLVTIVQKASRGCAASTRAKLLRVAETTDAVAVGWFHCDGHKCPASQARRSNQHFQEAFDVAMATRFGRQVQRGMDRICEPFVVSVSSAGVEGTKE